MMTKTERSDRSALDAVRGYVAGLNGTLDTYDPWPYVTDDYVYEVRGTTPISGVHVGLETINQNIWTGVYDKFAMVRMVIEEAQELEDGRVLTTLRSSNVNHDGSTYDQRSWYVFTVTSGRVSHATKCYIDSASVMESFPGAK